MSRTHYHFSQSIEGALKNWNRLEWLNVARNNGMTIEEIKIEFEIMLVQGKRLLPLGDCEGFSYVDGCPGHSLETVDTEAARG